MAFQRSSHRQETPNGIASGPEVLSLPPSCLVLSLEKLNEESEHSSSSELQSVCSYNSLSSLSSYGSEPLNKTEHQNVCSEGSTTSRPRSIFKTYWEKSGSGPSLSREGRSIATPVTASISSWDSDEQSAANSYERILKRNEGVKLKRRSIFGSQYQSMPSLARPYHPAPLERGTKSDSELGKKRLPSCLRSSNPYRGRASSVSFDCEVSVITYSSTQENWAAEGWSKMFH
jgi:hypothetical protein